MLDPVSLGVVITGLVGAYKAYADYRAVVEKARLAQHEPPAKTEAVIQGEQVAQVITAEVATHGATKEQQTLQLFEGDPATFEGALQTVLAQLAARSEPFAARLQHLADEVKLDPPAAGMHGEVNVTDHATVHGPVVGVSTGDITWTGQGNADDPHAGKKA
ncbi:hypothetical protein [Candidatus Chloroploca asiatica]|uniref:Uncharacterized protein n=1 Tax=Candidatus Chloroploca asiatica TaxID=1506545 RepID=A0A2H3L2E3_9CHLR|nr:hypothetical protein [Candidatus Chloroploca asiatica]PDV97317.1 hypothetical protein A9Q02_19025 [Candidatus Chloroploca asiatica]